MRIWILLQQIKRSYEGRYHKKRNERTLSDKLDSASASDKDADNMDKDKSELPKEASGEDVPSKKTTKTTENPDHTYTKTSDQEWRYEDVELEDMLPCRGTEELHLSDDNNNDDDYADNDNNDDYIVPGQHGTTLSAGRAQNLEGLVQVRRMSAKESSMSENNQESKHRR